MCFFWFKYYKRYYESAAYCLERQTSKSKCPSVSQSRQIHILFCPTHSPKPKDIQFYCDIKQKGANPRSWEATKRDFTWLWMTHVLMKIVADSFFWGSTNSCCSNIMFRFQYPQSISRGLCSYSHTVDNVLHVLLTEDVCSVFSGDLYVGFSEVLWRHTSPVLWSWEETHTRTQGKKRGNVGVYL